MKDALMLANGVWLILQQSRQQYLLPSALGHCKEVNKEQFQPIKF